MLLILVGSIDVGANNYSPLPLRSSEFGIFPWDARSLAKMLSCWHMPSCASNSNYIAGRRGRLPALTELFNLNKKTVPLLIIWTALILLMASWGGSFIATKIGVKYLTPDELILARFIPSAFFLCLIALFKRKDVQHRHGFWGTLSKRGKWGLAFAAFLAVPGYHFCLNTGLTIIPAGWASLVISLNPACITVFAAMILSEKIGLRRWSGILISFLALAYIALSRDIDTGNGEIMPVWTKALGMVITFGAVLSWGGFTVLGKKFIRDNDPLVVLSWIIGLGTLMVLPGIRMSFFQKMVEGPTELWVSVLFLSLI